MVSYDQAQKIITKEYSDMEVQFGFPYKNGYLFCLLPKGGSPEKDLSDFHMVNGTNGVVSGSLYTLDLMEDPDFQKSLSKVKKKSNVQEYLAHYGIEGQKWGVKNGPPYPLSESKHDAVVKKGSNSKKASSEAGKNGILLTLALTAVTNSMTRRHIEKHWDDTEWQEKRKEIGDTAEHIKESSKIMQSMNIISNKQFSSKNKPNKIVGEHSSDDDMKAVNPLFGPNIPGSINNCSLCSITYDLRRRGYDVVANLSTSPTNTDGLVQKVYKDAPYGKLKGIADTDFKKVEQNMLNEYPEGSRGLLQVVAYRTLYGIYGGHAMSFEIKKNKLIIIDSQSGKRETFDHLAKLGYSPKLTRAARLDNLEIDFDNLNMVCSERKKQKSPKNSEVSSK